MLLSLQSITHHPIIPTIPTSNEGNHVAEPIPLPSSVSGSNAIDTALPIDVEQVRDGITPRYSQGGDDQGQAAAAGWANEQPVNGTESPAPHSPPATTVNLPGIHTLGILELGRTTMAASLPALRTLDIWWLGRRAMAGTLPSLRTLDIWELGQNATVGTLPSLRTLDIWELGRSATA
jgi:hypothetical protein